MSPKLDSKVDQVPYVQSVTCTVLVVVGSVDFSMIILVTTSSPPMINI